MGLIEITGISYRCPMGIMKNVPEGIASQGVIFFTASGPSPGYLDSMGRTMLYVKVGVNDWVDGLQGIIEAHYPSYPQEFMIELNTSQSAAAATEGWVWYKVYTRDANNVESVVEEGNRPCYLQVDTSLPEIFIQCVPASCENKTLQVVLYTQSQCDQWEWSSSHGSGSQSLPGNCYGTAYSDPLPIPNGTTVPEFNITVRVHNGIGWTEESYAAGIAHVCASGLFASPRVVHNAGDPVTLSWTVYPDDKTFYWYEPPFSVAVYKHPIDWEQDFWQQFQATEQPHSLGSDPCELVYSYSSVLRRRNYDDHHFSITVHPTESCIYHLVVSANCEQYYAPAVAVYVDASSNSLIAPTLILDSNFHGPELPNCVVAVDALVLHARTKEVFGSAVIGAPPFYLLSDLSQAFFPPCHGSAVVSTGTANGIVKYFPCNCGTWMILSDGASTDEYNKARFVQNTLG
jgi:hypothetical protein